MKVLVIFVTLLVFAACEESCYKDSREACKKNTDGGIVAPQLATKCDAKYGAADQFFTDLQAYAHSHITRSFEYLLMSTYYGTHQKSRVGFEKLFRKLSDSSWEDGIELIKYITKRGGTMDFNAVDTRRTAQVDTPFELNELESMGRALDTQKALAEEAHRIHKEAIRVKALYHDPEVSSFLENHFVHKFASTIRELSGHSNDIKQIISGTDSSLSLFLFDEYLQKL